MSISCSCLLIMHDLHVGSLIGLCCCTSEICPAVKLDVSRLMQLAQQAYERDKATALLLQEMVGAATARDDVLGATRSRSDRGCSRLFAALQRNEQMVEEHSEKHLAESTYISSLSIVKKSRNVNDSLQKVATFQLERLLIVLQSTLNEQYSLVLLSQHIVTRLRRHLQAAAAIVAKAAAGGLYEKFASVQNINTLNCVRRNTLCESIYAHVAFPEFEECDSFSLHLWQEQLQGWRHYQNHIKNQQGQNIQQQQQKSQLQKRQHIQTFCMQQLREQHHKRCKSLLNVCAVLAKGLYTDWRFKQEVKEELHYTATLRVFRAATAAWMSCPFIGDMTSLSKTLNKYVQENPPTH